MDFSAPSYATFSVHDQVDGFVRSLVRYLFRPRPGRRFCPPEKTTERTQFFAGSRRTSSHARAPGKARGADTLPPVSNTAHGHRQRQSAVPSSQGQSAKPPVVGG